MSVSGHSGDDGGGRGAAGSYLSYREIDVLRLMAAGLTNRQVASVLHMSRHTVAHHLGQTLRRTGAQSRGELIARLRGRNLHGRYLARYLAAKPDGKQPHTLRVGRGAETYARAECRGPRVPPGPSGGELTSHLRRHSWRRPRGRRPVASAPS